MTSTTTTSTSTTTTSTSTSTTTTTIDLSFRSWNETVQLAPGLNRITVTDEAGFTDSIYVVRK